MPVNEEKGSCEIKIKGRSYKEILSMTLRKSIKEAAASGTIVLSWPGADVMNVSGLLAKAFMEGEDGEIILDGQLAQKIIFDTRISKGTPKSYELTLNFRGAQSTGIDANPKHDTGQINQKEPVKIMQELTKDTKIKIIDKSDGASQPIDRFIIAYGETIERACRRAARDRGLTFFGDKNGNWVVTGGKGSSEGGGDELRLGRNFVQWQTKRDLGPRYPEIDIQGAAIPKPKKYGKEAEADPFGTGKFQLIPGAQGILPAGRFLNMLVDTDQDKESIERYKKFEADRRANMGLDVTLQMSTWVNNSGQLWDLNQKYKVKIPIDEIDAELVVSQVEFELTPESRKCSVTLQGEGGSAGGAPAQPGETNIQTLVDQALQEQQPGAPEEEEPETPPPPPPSEEEPPKEEPARPTPPLKLPPGSFPPRPT